MGYKDIKKRREYQRLYVQKNRENWLRTQGPCVKCGSTDRLQIDHIDPKKKVTHRIWSWSAVRRLKELSKCQVLCHSCHWDKTKTEREKHNRTSAYRRGCRCDLCVESNRRYLREKRRADKLNGKPRKTYSQKSATSYN